MVKEDWPNDKSKLNNELQKFWIHREEIFCVNDVFIKSNKIIVPTTLRNEMWKIIHCNHMAIIKRLQLRTRQCLYCPNISEEINECE